MLPWLTNDWKEYKNRDYSFTVGFPADPMVGTATYRGADGRSFPAQVFAAKHTSPRAQAAERTETSCGAKA